MTFISKSFQEICKFLKVKMLNSTYFTHKMQRAKLDDFNSMYIPSLSAQRMGLRLYVCMYVYIYIYIYISAL